MSGNFNQTVTAENFGVLQGRIVVKAREIQKLNIVADYREAVSLAYSEIANDLNIDERTFRSEMGRMRNLVGRETREKKRSENGSKNGNGVFVQANFVPLVSSRIDDPEEKRREIIRKYLVAGLKSLSPKIGQKVVLTWIDKDSAIIARGLLRSIVPSLKWASFRSAIEGVDLIIERR